MEASELSLPASRGARAQKAHMRGAAALEGSESLDQSAASRFSSIDITGGENIRSFRIFDGNGADIAVRSNPHSPGTPSETPAGSSAGEGARHRRTSRTKSGLERNGRARSHDARLGGSGLRGGSDASPVVAIDGGGDGNEPSLTMEMLEQEAAIPSDGSKVSKLRLL